MKSLINIRPSDNEGYIELSLSLQDSFTVPNILMNGTVTEVQEFLGFFDAFMKREHEIFTRQKSKDIGASIEEHVRQSMTEEHIVETSRLKKEIDLLERKLRETTGESAALKGQLDVMKSGERTAEDEMRRRIEEDWTKRFKELKEEQERMTTFLKSELSAAKDQIRESQEKLMARESILKSSVRRGRAGEDGFAAAAEASCNWKLEHIADEARACDFKMDYNGCIVRFEIKNHESAVPGEDIKKFRRDLEEHRHDTGIGVFVALNAHLGGFMRGKFIHQEWKDDTGQLLIYISAFNELDTDFTFLLLRQVFDAFIKYKTIRDSDNDNKSIDYDGLRTRIDSAMIHAQTMNRHLRELTLKVGRDKKTVMKMYDDSLEMLKSCSVEYGLMIGLLLGEVDEVAAGSAGTTNTIVCPEEDTATVRGLEDITNMDDSQIIIVETPTPTPKKKRSGGQKKVATNN